MDFLVVAELFPDILKMLEEVQTLTAGNEEENDDKRMEKEVHIVFKAVKLILDKLEVVTDRLDKIENAK